MVTKKQLTTLVCFLIAVCLFGCVLKTYLVATGLYWQRCYMAVEIITLIYSFTAVWILLSFSMSVQNLSGYKTLSILLLVASISYGYLCSIIIAGLFS